MKHHHFLGLGLSIALGSTLLAACSSDTTSATPGGSDASAGGSGTGGAAAGGKTSTAGATGAGGKTSAGGAGGTTGSGGATTDAGTGGSDASTPSTGGTDAGPSADAAPPAACGSFVDAGSQCNELVNTGTDVTLTDVTGTLPTGTGGTIVDGLYHLTQLIDFPGSSVAGQVLVTKQTVLVCNGGTTSQHVDDQGGKTTRKNGTVSYSGIHPTFSNTCTTDTSTDIDWSSITATATGFTLYSTDLGAEAVFTKE